MKDQEECRGNDRDREPDLGHLPAKWIEGFTDVLHVPLQLVKNPFRLIFLPRHGPLLFGCFCNRLRLSRTFD